MPSVGQMVITSFVVVILGLQLSDQVVGHHMWLVVLLFIVPALQKYKSLCALVYASMHAAIMLK